MTLCTTLKRIREHHPCKSGWEKLLRHLGKTEADDEPLPFAVIVESNGTQDAIWCFRSVKYDRVWRLYAVWCARRVQHLMSDHRSIAALDVAQRYASGMATCDELERAQVAAGAGAGAGARAGARAGAPAAAWYAARAAERAAGWADEPAAAWYAARADERAAAWADEPAAAWSAQKAMLLHVVNAPTEADAMQILLDAMPATKRQAA